MTKKVLILALSLSFQLPALKAQITTVYFQKDSIKLELDFYAPAKSNKKLPLLLFAHGGGFSGGSKEGGQTVCKFAAEHGYAAASINYSLYMKGKDFGCGGSLTEKVKAIQIAVNQLWQATAYFIENSQKYNIDTTQIFIAGTSAGAETALHAAFWDRRLMNIYTDKLSKNFKYAGLIAGSGALMDLNLIKPSNLIPILLSHGNCDVTVPYGTAAHHFCNTNDPGWLMLFGSHSIYQHVEKMNGAVHLITYCGASHNVSEALFYEDKQYVTDFINQTLSKFKTQEHTLVKKGETSPEFSEFDFCK